MKNRLLKLSVYAASFLLVVLFFYITNSVADQDDSLDRITLWPDFNLLSYDGGSVISGELIGDTPVILVYFNTECQICQLKFEEIQTDGSLQQYARLVFVSDESPEIVNNYLSKTGIDQMEQILFLYDHELSVKEYFDIQGVPVTYIYTDEGELIRYYRGQVSIDELIAQLNTAE
jgi:peroxiredoxin